MSVGFSVIVAADEALGIGREGKLPWHLPGDMAFYKRTTSEAPAGKQNAVIMGRKTYASIPPQFRPLKNRLNVVLTRQRDQAFDPGVEQVDSLDAALRVARARHDVAKLFVIGGGELYREALVHPDCSELLLTRVHARFDCDTHLAQFEHAFERTHADGPHQDDGISYTFETYRRRA
ncbi:MAG TPA: dihydrofolate reductase [Polyangiales bacterium]